MMKHLLILISLLLLSSPVIGEETGVLYLYESSSGFVLKSFGNEKVQPKYEGEITNGKPNGFGVLTYPYDEESVVGEWKNGKEWNTKHTKKDGKLIGKFENGTLSWGVMFNSLRGGLSFKWYFEGDKKKDWYYLGDIKNGLPNGDGTQILPSGIKYVGEFKNGLRHGQGEEFHPDIGIKYVGEFKNGFHMWNTIKYKNGNIIGKYVNGEWIDP